VHRFANDAVCSGTSGPAVDRRSSWEYYLVPAVLAALAIRFAVIGFVYKDFLVPGREHWEFGYEMGSIARSIATGHGFANPFWIPTGSTAVITPVFPYLLAVVFKLFGVQTAAAALMMLGLNSAFSALTCVPMYFIAKETLGLREAKWAAWAWAVFPYAISFSADSMWCESLTALLLTSLLWITLELRHSESWPQWAGFGLLAGVTALTVPVTLSVIPFMAGWAAWQMRGKAKRWLAPAAVSMLALCATLLPWMVRNFVTFHQPVFIKDDFWLEVAVGNLGNAEHWWNGDVQPSGSPENLQQLESLGEVAYMQQKKVEAESYILSNPGVFLERSVRRVIFMWTGFWSLRPSYLKEEPLDPLNIVLCTSLTICAYFGIRTLFRKDKKIAWMYALPPLIFPISYYITHPDIEYRQPVDPEIVILACVGLLALVRVFEPKTVLQPEPAFAAAEVYDQVVVPAKRLN
jgi:hypothetical protein